MGFKCKCSFPHADLSWSPPVTSVSIYTRNSNKKSAALANMGNQHIIMCVAVVHLHIPCGGDEKAQPGCNLKAPCKNSYSKVPKRQEVSAVPQELSSFPMHVLTVAWSQESAGSEGGTLLYTEPNGYSLLTFPSDSGQEKARNTLTCCDLRQ